MNKPVVLVGEAWGKNEEELKAPFVGSSGITLFDIMAQVGFITLSATDKENIKQYWKTKNPYFTKLVWEAHPELYPTNVFNLRPKNNRILTLCGPKSEAVLGYPQLTKNKYVDLQYQTELDRLHKELEDVQPNLVIALGNTAAWALLRRPGVRNIRGAIAESFLGYKILPTYHPAAVMRNWKIRPVVLADFDKAKREREFHEVRRPRREIWLEPTLEDVHKFFEDYLIPVPDIACDIETFGDMITCIGFAASVDRAIVIPFYDPTKPDKNYWADALEELEVWTCIQDLLNMPKRFVFQNGIYDMSFLWLTMGIQCPSAAEDTMLMHHAMQPEMEKGLAFLGSIYTDEPSWKQTHKVNTIKKEG